MSKKKACKMCKFLYDENECPLCKSTQVSTTWLGRLAIVNTEKSEIAKRVGITTKGEYAIKVR